jgi:hypothetical protein
MKKLLSSALALTMTVAACKQTSIPARETPNDPTIEDITEGSGQTAMETIETNQTARQRLDIEWERFQNGEINEAEYTQKMIEEIRTSWHRFYPELETRLEPLRARPITSDQYRLNQFSVASISRTMLEFIDNYFEHSAEYLNSRTVDRNLELQETNEGWSQPQETNQGYTISFRINQVPTVTTPTNEDLPFSLNVDFTDRLERANAYAQFDHNRKEMLVDHDFDPDSIHDMSIFIHEGIHAFNTEQITNNYSNINIDPNSSYTNPYEEARAYTIQALILLLQTEEPFSTLSDDPEHLDTLLYDIEHPANSTTMLGSVMGLLKIAPFHQSYPAPAAVNIIAAHALQNGDRLSQDGLDVTDRFTSRVE